MASTSINNVFSMTPLERAKALQEQQLQRQSSGQRINSAKDDAAGLV
jgi:flagellin-like hook-associated protein FlgL